MSMYRIFLTITPIKSQEPYVYKNKKYNKNFGGFETKQDAQKFCLKFIKHGCGFNERFLKCNPLLHIQAFILKGDSFIEGYMRKAEYNEEENSFVVKPLFNNLDEVV